MDVTLESGTPAHVVRPDGAERGLVIIPDIWGLRPLFTDMCGDLSERTGWAVACIEPFPGHDLPGSDHPEGLTARGEVLRSHHDDQVLGDAVAAAEETGCEHVGLIGFCMGGMYALKASATGRFDRIVACYGMIKVPPHWQGPGQGQPLDALAEREGTEVMAIVGTADDFTPPEDVAELEAAGVTVVRYEGAEHGFVHDPSRPTHRPDDAADVWERALTFLGGGSPS